MMRNPFDLADDAAYRLWRDAKLARHPQRVEELIVEWATRAGLPRLNMPRYGSCRRQYGDLRQRAYRSDKFAAPHGRHSA